MAEIIPFPVPLPSLLEPAEGLPWLAAALEAQRRAFIAWRCASADLARGLAALGDALTDYETALRV